jgi:hypothetical protein
LRRLLKSFQSKKPVIVAVAINIRVLVVEVGWRRGFWTSGSRCERTKSEFAGAVVIYFWFLAILPCRHFAVETV